MIDIETDSFLISVYQQCLSDLSRKWKISIPLLDHNLARLHQCVRQCLVVWQATLPLNVTTPTTATFSIEELPRALEFYLQIDGRTCCVESIYARFHEGGL